MSYDNLHKNNSFFYVPAYLNFTIGYILFKKQLSHIYNQLDSELLLFWMKSELFIVGSNKSIKNFCEGK